MPSFPHILLGQFVMSACNAVEGRERRDLPTLNVLPISQPLHCAGNLFGASAEEILVTIGEQRIIGDEVALESSANLTFTELCGISPLLEIFARRFGRNVPVGAPCNQGTVECPVDAFVGPISAQDADGEEVVISRV